MNIQMRKRVFIPSFVLLACLLIFGYFAPAKFSEIAYAAFYFIVQNFGWLYLLIGIAFLVLMIYLFIAPIGKARLGGKDAKPTMSTFNWFAIALCTGIAIGIMFWGVAEPLSHYGSPMPMMGVEAETDGAVISALAVSYMHWSFTPYAIYAGFGIAIAFAAFNLNRPLSMSSALYPLIGEKASGWVSDLVDAVIIICFVGAEMAGLGFASMQLAQGIQFIFGIPVTSILYTLILAFVATICIASSYSGIQKGIRILSDINTKLFFFLLTAAFLLGPTRFIIDAGFTSIGQMMGDFVPFHLFRGITEDPDSWSNWWTVFYWAWWIVYAPVVGAFLAKISYGRTFREFITVNFFLPALFGIVWFNIIGGSALNQEFVQGLGLLATLNEQGEAVMMFAMLDNLPLAVILVPIALLITALSYITGLDSCITTISLLGTTTPNDGETEPPGKYKIIWGLLLVSLALIILTILPGDTLDTVQMLSVLASVPIVFLCILAVWGMVSASLNKGHVPHNYDKEQFYAPRECAYNASSILDSSQENPEKNLSL